MRLFTGSNWHSVIQFHLAVNLRQALASGARGRSVADGVLYHYKGTRIHNITKDVLFQAGDLLDEKGNCSRSIFNQGGLFRDENYILRYSICEDL